jgi:hypothetical protein
MLLCCDIATSCWAAGAGGGPCLWVTFRVLMNVVFVLQVLQDVLEVQRVVDAG